MLDLDKETLLTLEQAAEYVPALRGKKVAKSTVWRWIVHGHRAIYLEAVKLPGGWVTSQEAVQRFMAALAEAERTRHRPAPSAAPVPAIAVAAEEAWAQKTLADAWNGRLRKKA